MQNSKNNYYDDIRRITNLIRKFNDNPELLKEQQFESSVIDDSTKTDQNNSNFTNINGVDVVFDSTDQMDYNVREDERGKISQLIDDFKREVSEIVDFGKLIFYENSAKLDGRISDPGINFILSGGDDSGVFLNANTQLKLSDENIDIINKLRTFSDKFISISNELIANRQNN